MAKLILKDEYSYTDIFNAYMDCRRLKRNKRSSIAFEIRFEIGLSDLLDEVNSGQYEIGRSEVFVVTSPKPREIWAAKFRDRIVHHLVYNDIGAFFEDRLIEDTYSCIKGRGSLAASNKLVQHHRRATGNYANDIGCFQFDIRNFFVSIDKDILWKLLKQHIGTDSLTAKLVNQIVFNDPTVNAVIKSGAPADCVPPHKSLWNAPKGRGLPIGNLTSQFFSNVYMNPLDQFIKHKLRVKNYVRYVDDAVILHKDMDTLSSWKSQIEQFLQKELSLQLHPDKSNIFLASQGINFVGYIVKPYRRYIRNSTVLKAKSIVERPCADIIPSINSYLGLMKHCNSYTLCKMLCERLTIPTQYMPACNYSKMVKL